MARREKKQQVPAPTAQAQVQERGGGTRVSARERRLTARREKKFKRHKVEIVARSSTDLRVIRGNEETVHFKYMILGNKLRVGEATTMRHALKRAHQHCKLLTDTAQRSR